MPLRGRIRLAPRLPDRAASVAERARDPEARALPEQRSVLRPAGWERKRGSGVVSAKEAKGIFTIVLI